MGQCTSCLAFARARNGVFQQCDCCGCNTCFGVARDAELEKWEVEEMLKHPGFSAIRTQGGHLLPTVVFSCYMIPKLSMIYLG